VLGWKQLPEGIFPWAHQPLDGRRAASFGGCSLRCSMLFDAKLAEVNGELTVALV